MMTRETKSWGVKTSLFKNDLCEVSLLTLNGGQRCSWHKHRSKWNQFYVVSGVLTVKTEEGFVEIRKGEVFTTKPEQMHEFQTPNGDCVVIEIMYVKYDSEDIQRENIGGSISSFKSEFFHKEEPKLHDNAKNFKDSIEKDGFRKYLNLKPGETRISFILRPSSSNEEEVKGVKQLILSGIQQETTPIGG